MNHRKMKKEYINPTLSTIELVGFGALMTSPTKAKPGGGGPDAGDTPLSGAPKHRPF